MELHTVAGVHFERAMALRRLVIRLHDSVRNNMLQWCASVLSCGVNRRFRLSEVQSLLVHTPPMQQESQAELVFQLLAIAGVQPLPEISGLSPTFAIMATDQIGLQDLISALASIQTGCIDYQSELSIPVPGQFIQAALPNSLYATLMSGLGPRFRFSRCAEEAENMLAVR